MILHLITALNDVYLLLFLMALLQVSSLAALPVNTALLQLIGSGEVPQRYLHLNRLNPQQGCFSDSLPSRYRTLPPELQPEEVEPYRLALR